MAIFQSPKNNFSEAKFSKKNPENPQKERFLPNFRLRNLKIQSPKNCNSIPSAFHTPTRLPPNNFTVRREHGVVVLLAQAAQEACATLAESQTNRVLPIEVLRSVERKPSLGRESTRKNPAPVSKQQVVPLTCDQGRHLQECSGARAGKCPPECFFSVFGRLAPSAPKSAF